jgi:hypothetical protein
VPQLGTSPLARKLCEVGEKRFVNYSDPERTLR